MAKYRFSKTGMGVTSDVYDLTTGLTISGTGATGIELSATLTTGILFSGAIATPFSITGASTTSFSISGTFVTGLAISGDGTTGLGITDGFSGVNMISLDGTASTAGINLSGDCATGILVAGDTTDAISITGACGDNGLEISGACTGSAIEIVTGGFGIGVNVNADGTTGIAVANTFSGTTMLALAGTGTDGINISGICGDAIEISAAATTTGLNISADCVTGITISAQTTAGITCAGGASYNPIHIGAKDNVANAGLILVGATDDTGGVMIFADDGGAALGNVTSPIWARYLITVNQSGGATATGMFAQIKTQGTRVLTTGGYTALKAYNQTGTVTLVTGAEHAIINAGMTLEGNFVNTSGRMSGIDVNINTSTYTITDTAADSAGIHIRKTSTSTYGWPVGIKINDGGATTGIEIGTCTDGINFSGLCGGHAIDTAAYGDIVIGNRTAASGLSISTGGFHQGLLVAVEYDAEGVANTTDYIGCAAIFNYNHNLTCATGGFGTSGMATIASHYDIKKEIYGSGGLSCGWFPIWAEAAGTNARIRASAGARSLHIQCVDAAIVTGAAFDLGANCDLFGIRVDSSVNSGCTMSGHFYGINIDASGTSMDWQIGINIDNATTGIALGSSVTTGISLAEDVTLAFGSSNEIAVSWTGQELLFEDTRTIDVSDGYNRTIHVGNTITMTASRYAAVSCYTTVVGAGGLDAYGAKFSMVQNATSAVTGHYGAVMAEVKNTVNSTACCTASALFCRWDNDAATGFGGDQSFIRCEDNSSQTKVKYLIDGLTLSTAEDSTAVLLRTGGHAANNIVNTAGIHVRVNGAAYYIPLIPESDWVND